MESDYSYLKEQERTWSSLGFNSFMVRTTVSADTNAMSSDDFNAMMQGGAIGSDKLVAVAVSQLLSGVINAVVDIGNGPEGTYLRLDGPENRFVIHDGITPRVVQGRV